MIASSPPPLLSPGDAAPDGELTDTNGMSTLLSAQWRQVPEGGATALVFLRHLGCIFCREQVAALRAGFSALQEAGVAVICVAQGEPKTGKALTLLLDMPFPLLLCGDDMSVYRAYGLVPGTSAQLFGLKSITRGFLALAHGYRQGKLEGDGYQLGGAFLVDRTGTIRWAHPCENASDIVTPHDLLSSFSALPKETAV